MAKDQTASNGAEVVEVMDGLLTDKQVRRMFNKSWITIHLWRKNKGLPYVRIPGDGRDTIRFRLSRVLKWAKKVGKEVLMPDELPETDGK